jgi:hypothetical protein
MDTPRPATSRFDEAMRANFDSVRRAIATHGAGLRAVPGVIGVRPGFRFHQGWITDEPAVVITVRSKLPDDQVPAGQMLPRSLDGVPVDVTSASPLEQLASEAVSKGLAGALAPEDQPALPDWERDAGADVQALAAEAKKPTRPYIAPADIPLAEFKGPMTLTCHASPDAGWTTLGPFLAATKHRLTVGMFDFSAPHILEALGQAMAKADGPLVLVLDPALTLGQSKNPTAPRPATSPRRK